MTAKAYVNRQGGMRIRTLNKEAASIIHWAETHIKSLKAVHVPGQDNVLADRLSRVRLDENEWMLNREVFNMICDKFGTPEVDLFATLCNRQVPNFFARHRDPEAVGLNAISSSWPQLLLLAFPPIQLISHVIQKLIQQRAEMVLIAPHWPRRIWFQDLQRLSIQEPWHLPLRHDLLTQGNIVHPNPQTLQLTTWRLSAQNY